MTVYYITWRLIALIFIIISNIIITRAIRGAIIIGIIDIIFLIFLLYVDIVPVLNREPTIFGFGFYLGFISCCVYIWIIILLSKYEKEKLKSLITIGKPKPIYEERVLKKKGKLEDRNNLIGFISYAMADSQLFNIRKIAEELTKYDKIEDILYFEEDTQDNFIKYMDRNISRCDVIILFCSPNALRSEFVEDEWMAAHAIKKPIIPVFINRDHIPTLLRARIGVKFDVFNLKKNIKNIYDIIEKKLHS